MTNHYLDKRNDFWNDVLDEFGHDTIVVHKVDGKYVASADMPDTMVELALKELLPAPKSPTPTPPSGRRPKSATGSTRPKARQALRPAATVKPLSTSSKPSGVITQTHDMLAWAKATGRAKPNTAYVKQADRKDYPGKGNWNRPAKNHTNGATPATVLRPFAVAAAH